MNTSFRLAGFAVFMVIITIGSFARAQGPASSNDGKKTVAPAPSLPALVSAPNTPALMPVPEPSAGAMILLGLGGVGLAMKLRRLA